MTKVLEMKNSILTHVEISKPFESVVFDPTYFIKDYLSLISSKMIRVSLVFYLCIESQVFTPQKAPKRPSKPVVIPKPGQYTPMVRRLEKLNLRTTHELPVNPIGHPNKLQFFLKI